MNSFYGYGSSVSDDSSNSSLSSSPHSSRQSSPTSPSRYSTSQKSTSSSSNQHPQPQRVASSSSSAHPIDFPQNSNDMREIYERIPAANNLLPRERLNPIEQPKMIFPLETLPPLFGKVLPREELHRPFSSPQLTSQLISPHEITGITSSTSTIASSTTTNLLKKQPLSSQQQQQLDQFDEICSTTSYNPPKRIYEPYRQLQGKKSNTPNTSDLKEYFMQHSRIVYDRNKQSTSGGHTPPVANLVCDFNSVAFSLFNFNPFEKQESSNATPNPNTTSNQHPAPQQQQQQQQYSSTSSDILNPTQLKPQSESVQFESRFESGNLSYAAQIKPREYELILNNDFNTKSNAHWFFFRTKITNPNQPVRFHILNLHKKESLFSEGMKILVFSKNRHAQEGTGWFRTCSDITYTKNGFLRHTGTTAGYSNGIWSRDFAHLQQQYYYTLSFTYKHETPPTSQDNNTLPPQQQSDEVYFAYHYPYTYSELQLDLNRIITNHSSLVYRKQLCRTFAGNRVDLLTITSPAFTSIEKKIIVISARVHPGESVSSLVMKGLLDFLTSDSPTSRSLLERFVFKIVPMLNPDGVIHGNYRCNLSGFDLNRCWRSPSATLHPEIHSFKAAIAALPSSQIALVCDLHAHSSKKNIFMYGCHDPQRPLACREFPFLLSKIYTPFQFADCNFTIQQSKRGSARVALYKLLRNPNVFTLESSFCGPSYDNIHFNFDHFIEMGHALCKSFLLYFTAPADTSTNPTQIMTSTAFTNKSNGNITLMPSQQKQSQISLQQTQKKPISSKSKSSKKRSKDENTSLSNKQPQPLQQKNLNQPAPPQYLSQDKQPQSKQLSSEECLRNQYLNELWQMDSKTLNNLGMDDSDGSDDSSGEDQSENNNNNDNFDAFDNPTNLLSPTKPSINSRITSTIVHLNSATPASAAGGPPKILASAATSHFLGSAVSPPPNISQSAGNAGLREKDKENNINGYFSRKVVDQFLTKTNSSKHSAIPLASAMTTTNTAATITPFTVEMHPETIPSSSHIKHRQSVVLPSISKTIFANENSFLNQQQQQLFLLPSYNTSNNLNNQTYNCDGFSLPVRRNNSNRIAIARREINAATLITSSSRSDGLDDSRNIIQRRFSKLDNRENSVAAAATTTTNINAANQINPSQSSTITHNNSATASTLVTRKSSLVRNTRILHLPGERSDYRPKQHKVLVGNLHHDPQPPELPAERAFRNRTMSIGRPS